MDTRNMKGNTIPPKKNNNSLEMHSKLKGIYEKDFKIKILKKLSVMQENTDRQYKEIRKII
jgi:hypothetical protein